MIRVTTKKYKVCLKKIFWRTNSGMHTYSHKVASLLKIALVYALGINLMLFEIKLSSWIQNLLKLKSCNRSQFKYYHKIVFLVLWNTRLKFYIFKSGMDIGLWIALVPKVLEPCYLIRWLKNFGYFYRSFISWFQNSSYQTCQPLFILYRIRCILI